MALFPVGGMTFGGPSSPSEPATVGQGKNSKQQNLGSPHAGMKSTVPKGDPLSRSMSHYGKGHSFSLTKDAPSLGKFRGGGGGMKRIRGGLGPGRMGQAGSSKDYSMTSPDIE